ncbi:MAG: hypothetical protein RL213_1221 [Bacteroidota bacterium]|jgi:hypothetical protein
MKKILLAATVFVSAVSLHAQHVVSLKTGEKLSGKVQSLSNGVVDFLFQGNVMKLRVDEIYSINFADQATSMNGGVSSSSAPREAGEKQVTADNYLVRYKVADRTVVKPPKIDNLTQKKGTVVVDITIDKYGSVRKAVPGMPGTTTSDEYLKTKARQAAESTLFDNVPTAPTEQKGYMIIVF